MNILYDLCQTIYDIICQLATDSYLQSVVGFEDTLEQMTSLFDDLQLELFKYLSGVGGGLGSFSLLTTLSAAHMTFYQLPPSGHQCFEKPQHTQISNFATMLLFYFNTMVTMVTSSGSTLDMQTSQFKKHTRKTKFENM